MPGLSGAPPQSSYTVQFTRSYGQQHDNANALPQYQHPPQMLAPPTGQSSGIQYEVFSRSSSRSWYWTFYLRVIIAVIIVFYIYRRILLPTWKQAGQNHALLNIFKHKYIERDSSDLPDEFDWRNYGVLPFVRDQGQCGSCYAIACIAALESLIAIHTGILVNLSPKEILDCDDRNRGCEGGGILSSFKYMVRNGIGLEKDYPYKTQSCILLITFDINNWICRIYKNATATNCGSCISLHV